MPLLLERTLGDLRSELQARCHFANQGPSSLLNRTIFNSFLRDAQIDIYWMLNDQKKRRQSLTVTTAVGQILYDWPDTLEPGQLRDGVHVLLSVDGLWHPVTRGIDYEEDTLVASRTWPQKWDHRGGQFEVWPEPDGIYTVRFDDWGALSAFSQDTHRASVNSDLLFKLSLYKAKAHYRQPDAAEALESFNLMQSNYLSLQMEGLRFIRSSRRSHDATQEPYGIVPPVRV